MINAGRRQWRRVHRDGTIAEVTPVTDLIVAWEACVRRRGRADADNLGRAFPFLSEAQAAADRLALALCPHACDEHCEFWDPVERRKKSRSGPRG